MATQASNIQQYSDTAKKVVDQFNASWKYAKQNHHDRWERNYKLYNNVRVARSYVGTSNTFVPIPFSTIETATAAMTSGRPSIDFVPQDMYKYIMSYYSSGVKPDLKALNSLFDYYWECDNWDLKTIKTVRNGFTYGIAGEYYYWDVNKPRILNIAPRDLIIDPNLSDPMQAIANPNDYYMGRRYLTTIEALKAERMVDPENPGATRPRFKNLSKVTPGSTGGEPTEKELKEIFLGATGDTSNLVEVIEVITGETIRSVANRTIDIENRKNELGMINIALHRFIADESTIFGKAIIDPIAKQAELLNDVTDQSVDAVTDLLSPQWELDPLFADQIKKVSNKPGTVYPFAPGTLRMIAKQPVDASAFNERTNMKNEMREATGIDQIVQGVQNDSSATATEINAQLNQAGQRFSLFVKMLEREGLYQRAKIVYKMILHYVRDMQLVPTNTMDGPKFYKFDPNQFDDTFEPQIQLESTVKNRRRIDQGKALEAYQALIQDPTNDLWEAKKIMYPKMFEMTEEELDRIIGPQKPQAMGGMSEGMPAAEGALEAPEAAMPPEMPEMQEMPVDAGMAA
jgi:hypothetical protein